jgi:hypothetical protein
MTRKRIAQFTHLEGCRVSLALRDGSRLDDCQLVSTGHNRAGSVWLFSNGADTFVPVDSVVDLWEVPAR